MLLDWRTIIIYVIYIYTAFRYPDPWDSPETKWLLHRAPSPTEATSLKPGPEALLRNIEYVGDGFGVVCVGF